MTTIEHKINTTIEAIESVDDYTLFAVDGALDSLEFQKRLTYGYAKNRLDFEIDLINHFKNHANFSDMWNCYSFNEEDKEEPINVEFNFKFELEDLPQHLQDGYERF
jgi:hypothetical protein